MNHEFDETPAASTTPAGKWAIVAALAVLASLIAFAPRGAAEGALPLPEAYEDVRGATAAEVNSSGYRGPGPRFAEPRNGPTPYEEAQAWAAETEESETPSEAPPLF